jgi:predicted nucleic acid-binding protein
MIKTSASLAICRDKKDAIYVIQALAVIIVVLDLPKIIRPTNAIRIHHPQVALFLYN